MMCGRFALATPLEKICETWQLPFQNLSTVPRYNISPGKKILVLEGGETPKFVEMHWGMDLFSASHRRNFLINARLETIAVTPSFKKHFLQRRCLIPADGFYEWSLNGKQRVPWFFTSPTEQVLAVAGIYTQCGIGENAISSCVIITEAASCDVAPVHHRMPLLLEEKNRQKWLNPSLSTQQLSKLVEQRTQVQLRRSRVTKLVNNPLNEGPELLHVDEEEQLTFF